MDKLLRYILPIIGWVLWLFLSAQSVTFLEKFSTWLLSIQWYLQIIICMVLWFIHLSGVWRIPLGLILFNDKQSSSFTLISFCYSIIGTIGIWWSMTEFQFNLPDGNTLIQGLWMGNLLTMGLLIVRGFVFMPITFLSRIER